MGRVPELQVQSSPPPITPSNQAHWTIWTVFGPHLKPADDQNATVEEARRGSRRDAGERRSAPAPSDNTEQKSRLVSGCCSFHGSAFGSKSSTLVASRLSSITRPSANDAAY